LRVEGCELWVVSGETGDRRREKADRRRETGEGERQTVGRWYTQVGVLNTMKSSEYIAVSDF
jgi:hypothetical protein